MVGMKQMVLLEICKDKGYLTVLDTRNVLGLPFGRTFEESKRQSRIAELKLKGLETSGHLKRQNDKYILTELGKKIVDHSTARR